MFFSMVQSSKFGGELDIIHNPKSVSDKLICESKSAPIEILKICLVIGIIFLCIPMNYLRIV